MPVLLLSNPESKSLSRKSLKKLTSFPYSKRPRAEQQNYSVVTASAHDRDVKKIGYDNARCISDEKCRIVKQKRGQDSKRIDKKSFKASVRTKFDPFTSKGVLGSDSASVGIETYGIYGLKSDLYDVTKSVEELSLDELLDGSYKNPNLCLEKGNKASSCNENILLSVRKACSILPLHGAANNYGNGKTSASLQNPSSSGVFMSDGDEKDKGGEESSSKFQDSSQAILSTSTLHRPKDILERLTLPPKLNLEDFISNYNPSQRTMGKEAFSSSSLPPFPWSFSHGGTYKPVLDSCRSIVARNGSQNKWVRTERRSASTGGGSNCFCGFEEMTFDHYGNLANWQKNDELLQDVNALSESVAHPFNGPQNTPESHGLHCSNLSEESGASCSHLCRKLESQHTDTSENQAKGGSKDNLFRQISESEVGLRCLRNELSLADSSKPDPLYKDNEIVQDKHPRKATDDCCRSCCGYSLKCSTRGYYQGFSHLVAPEVAKPGHSSQLHVAATILCQMASCPSAKRVQKDSFTRIKSPRADENTKDHRTSSSADKTERLFLAPRNHESFKRTAIPSSRHKLISEQQSKLLHKNNVGREPVKLFLSAEVGCTSRKLEKDYVKVNHRLLHGNAIKPSGLMQSRLGVENVFGCHWKLGKEKLNISSVGFEESYTKDRSIVKSKRGKHTII